MIYTRQAGLVKPYTTTVAVIGCGGVGSWIALFLALAGITDLELWDADVVDGTNLARTPYRPADVGKQKSEALKALIQEYRPDSHVWASDNWQPGFPLFELFPPTHGTHTRYIVGAVDGTTIRRDLRSYAPTVCASYIDVGVEGDGFNISDSPADWQLDSSAENQRGYFTPSYIGPVATVAAMTTWIILSNKICGVPTHFRFDAETLTKPPKGDRT